MRWFPAIVTAVLAFPSPAHAKIAFDFDHDTGFVDAEDVRRAFDWDAATLRARAGQLAFEHGKLVQDVYAVVCGKAGAAPIRAVHAVQGATWFLTAEVVRKPAGDDVSGFRITGAYAGISGTTPAPAPGMPCPQAKPGGKVHSARLVSTTVTNTLFVESGAVSAQLFQIRTGPEAGRPGRPGQDG